MDRLIITAPEVDGRRVRFRAGKRHLDYEVSEPSLLSDTCDAAVVALLIPAMREGRGLDVRGPLSARLHWQLPRLQALLQSVMPDLQAVDIVAADLTTRSSGGGVLTGLSGGVDSFCVLADHLDRITHLLFNDVGSHAGGGRALFRERVRRLEPVAAALGLPIVRVTSNLDSFYAKSFQQTHTLRNASVALLLSGGIGQYLYASAFAYGAICGGPSKDLATADPVTLPLASTEAVDLVAVGSEYTRVEKTVKVAGVALSHDALDVCVNDGHEAPPINCSACWKCMRTLATLEIAGMLDRYRAVFDFDAYRARRTGYFVDMLASDDPLVVEVREFAEEQGFDFPAASQLVHRLRIRRPVRKFLQVQRRLLGTA